MNHAGTPADTQDPFYIVGVGASAGGLDAIRQLFANVTKSGRAAYVVIQHLSPHHPSLMAEILAEYTLLHVQKAEDGDRLKPDHVYLLPPRKVMTVQDGCLRLTEKPEQGLTMTIDLFLSSLAVEADERAIAIILSGTGSDGSRGILDIKDNGGLILVQDGQSAMYGGMPMQALMTGKVDYTLDPRDMGDLLRSLTSRRLPGKNGSTRAAETAGRSPLLRDLVKLLRRETHVDFGFYRTVGFERRVQRRMTLLGLNSLRDYLAYAQTTPQELVLLRRDLLVSVTHFFRDPEAFEVLERRVLPAVFEARHERELRLWSAGCATGEEAYSLAILMAEYAERRGIVDGARIRIFATDLNKDAVEYAMTGMYPSSIEKSLSRERLDRFFVKSGDTYRVNDTIRQMIVFLPHNLTQDPPFHQIDLIACRNMLIYLEPEAQKKVLSLFHYALHAGGYLFLGPSESVHRISPHFATVDARWNIYRSREGRQPLAAHSLEGLSELRTVLAAPPSRGEASRVTGSIRQTRSLEQVLLSEHIEPGLVLDETGKIVHITGDISPYLMLGPGQPSWKLPNLVGEEQAETINRSIKQAMKTGCPVHLDGLRTEDGRAYELTVGPFSVKQSAYSGWALLTFHSTEPSSAS